MANTSSSLRSERQRAKSRDSTKRSRASKRRPTAEAIARMADRGEDVSKYFTNKGRIIEPVRTVSVPLAEEMLGEIDTTARKLRLTRQAAIRVLIRDALDRREVAHHPR